MKDRRVAPDIANLRVLFSILLVFGLILVHWTVSPAYPHPTTAQGMTPFPPEGDWYTYANGDDVLVLEVEGDVLWAGTRAGGLVRWNLTDGTFVQFLKPQDGLSGNTVRDIFIDAEGHKWLATDHGISVLDDQGTADKSDDVWYTYTRATTNGNLPSDQVTAVAIDEAGHLWIGTQQYWDPEAEAFVGGGLARVDTKGTLDPSDDEWIHTYTVDNTLSRRQNDLILGLASDNIADILPVPGDRVWVATRRHLVFRQFDPEDPGQWVQIYGGLSRLDHGGTPETEDDNWQTWNCEQSAKFACTVIRLKLDPLGYVWAATRGRGVIAFPYDEDGALDYVQFRTSDGLPTNDIDAIAFGPTDNPQWQNTVWLGVYNASSGYGRGVCILDHKGTLEDKTDDTWNDWTPTGECLTTESGLPDNRVQALALGDGKIWMGIGGMYGIAHGISAFDLEQLAVQEPLTTAAEGLPYNYITDLAIGQPGTRWENQVWVGTGNKRERKYGVGALLLNTQGTLDPADDTWTQFTKEGTDDNNRLPWTGLASNSITSIAIDGDYVWFGTQKATWDSRRQSWTDGGLSVYDGEQWTTRTDYNTGGQYAGLRDDRISAITLGCEGELWIALGGLRDNSGIGIDVLDTQGDPHNLSNDEWGSPITYNTIPSNLVTGIATDCARTQLWISTEPYFTGFGTEGGGVARYDYEIDRWTSWRVSDGIESFEEGRNHGAVQSIHVGPDGTVWAGTWGTSTLSRQALIDNWPYVPAAINWFRDGIWSSRVFPNDGWVSSIAVDQEGVVWIGTSRGGMDVDPPDGKEDDAFAGRAVGGIKLTIDGTQWVTMTLENSPLPTNDIEVITVAPDGDVWIGTNGWGILRFHPKEPATPTPTPTDTLTPTVTPLVTATPTPTATPSVTPSATLTPTPSLTPTPTETLPPIPGVRVVSIYMPLLAKDWIYRPFPEPTVEPSATPTSTPTVTPVSSATPTQTPSASPTSTATSGTAATPTPTLPASPTATATVTTTPVQPSPSVTSTVTATPTPTSTPTSTPAQPSPTATPTVTATTTPTPTPTATPTIGLTPTVPSGVWCEPGSTEPACSDVTFSLFTTKDLYDVAFIDSRRGFIVGEEGFVAQTRDGGNTWTWRQWGTATLRDVFMVNPQVAFIAGDDKTILRTTNGGSYFSKMAMPAMMLGHDEDFWAIYALSATDAWAMGHNDGSILHLNGDQWEFVRWTGYSYTGLAIPAPNLGWAISEDGNIFKYNGQWTEASSMRASAPLRAIVMPSATDGWAAGESGVTARYANGRWVESTPINGIPHGTITGLYALAPDDIWATASTDGHERTDGVIYRYRGNRWEQVAYTFTERLNSIWVSDTLTNGWAVGNNGLIMRYVIPSNQE